jgi:hypothetical protein
MKIGYFRRICKLSDCLYDLQEMDVIMAFDDGEFKEIICTVQLEGLKEGTDIKFLIKRSSMDRNKNLECGTSILMLIF